MKTFTDNTGRVWTVSVNVGTLKRVRSLCGVDLAAIIAIDSDKKPNVDLLEKLSTDPILLVDVLYAVCKTEADGRNVSDEEFGRSMAGDAVEQATTALLDEVVDFFPETKRRVFRKILDATRRFENRTRKAMTGLLDDPELDGKLDNALERLTSLSPSSPESPE